MYVVAQAIDEAREEATPGALIALDAVAQAVEEAREIYRERYQALAQATGHPDRVVGLHVFNPVPRMELIELAYGPETRDDVRRRARDLCTSLGKTPVEVPDTPGFVVNRLLFPYLFGAVDLMVSSGMSPADVDRCMTLGAGMPMGPIALLDFVGLDVSQAIGETIGASVPQRVSELVEQGSLGRKSKQGFYSYE